MNIRARYLIAAWFAIVLGGCQVVSGLTGVDLDGNGGKDAGPGNACEQANEKLKTCAGSLGSISIAAKCDTKHEQCLASCANDASCSAIKQSSPGYRKCLQVCQ